MSWGAGKRFKSKSDKYTRMKEKVKRLNVNTILNPFHIYKEDQR